MTEPSGTGRNKLVFGGLFLIALAIGIYFTQQTARKVAVAPAPVSEAVLADPAPGPAETAAMGGANEPEMSIAEPMNAVNPEPPAAAPTEVAAVDPSSVPQTAEPMAESEPAAGTETTLNTPPETPKVPPPPLFDLVRVDREGGALIAGRARPNASVTVLIDGKPAAQAQADASGDFVALFGMGPSDAARVVSLESEAVGQESAHSAQEVIVAPSPRPVEAVAAADAPEAGAAEAQEPAEVAAAESEPEPAAPTVLLAENGSLRVLQSADAPEAMTAVAIDAITYDVEGDVTLAGRGSDAGEGSFVRVYLDNEPIRTAQVTRDGSWSAELPEVDTGVYTLRVDQVDAAGNVTSRAETPFKREAPEAVQAAGAASAGGNITVQPGNTLWGISEASLGNGILYVSIFQKNRGSIRNPDLIYPGQIFSVPTSDEASASFWTDYRATVRQ